MELSCLGGGCIVEIIASRIICHIEEAGTSQRYHHGLKYNITQERGSEVQENGLLSWLFNHI